MNEKEIEIIIEELNRLSETTTANNRGGVYIVADPDQFGFEWIFDNNSSYPSDKTIPVSSFNEAVKIVCIFSGKKTAFVEEKLHNKDVDENNPVFLHFLKVLKI